jgi:ATP-dependent exoDNAse (exonuclease V) beta subunit
MPSEMRRFIGWDHPVLPKVVQLLFDEYVQGNHWDLGNLQIVLPGGLAVRRLRELLVLLAEQSGVSLYPPSIVTVGLLPEQLYVARKPFAGDLVQMLAWVSALRQAPREQLQLLTPNPPDSGGASDTNQLSSAWLQWLELGRILLKLHRELSSDRMDFSSVSKALGRNHVDAARWQALAKLQRHYLDVLHQLGLWDIQTARLRALEENEARTQRRIIVVGCVDLNRTQRGFLDAMPEKVQVWVAAPPQLSHCFDPFGCLESEHWQGMTIDLPPDCLLVGNSPADQAELTSAALAELGDRFHTRDVTLGVPDTKLIPELQHRLSQSGLNTRFGPGKPLTRSEPVQLLALVGRFLREQSFPEFSALVRHPAVGRFLRSSDPELPIDWVKRLDDFHAQTLIYRLDGFVSSEAKGAETFQSVLRSVMLWLQPLLRSPQRLSGWAEPLLQILRSAYTGEQIDLQVPEEHQLVLAVSQLTDAIGSLKDIPQPLEPTLNASQLIDWLLGQLAGQLVPEPPDSQCVEMLGWLELALDDAPALIVTGMHDGVTPESVNADPFLPNKLRRQLGMLDNARRFARDIYSMQVMLASRQYLRIIVGKWDSAGNPFAPSRLLLACPLEHLPSRVLHLTQEENSDILDPVWRSWKPTRGASRLAIPKPGHVDPPKTITVTAFRDYIRCPYRFYLRHVLRLRDRYQESIELDASMFGNLVHDTLESFGKSPVSGSADAEEIRDFLFADLEQRAKNQFGPHPPATVTIQIEQARFRLEAFASKQAGRAAEGWKIHCVESSCGQDDQVMVGTRSELCLIGRIDRIDYHPETNQWAIWDYKTSESAKKPESVHWSERQGWLDLQLPLYLPIARKMGVTGAPSVGYIALPRRIEDVDFYTAAFDEKQLVEARAAADEIATRVANCEFWPESIQAVDYDDFARICQVQSQRVQVAPPCLPLRRFQGYQTHRVQASVVADANRRLNGPLNRASAAMPPLLIRASAGTGKTFQLTNRLLKILLAGQEIDSILATTFTRKAAGEIMHRVLQRLALACVDDDHQRELSLHVQQVDTSPASCLAALRRVTAGIHRFRICTLDSFFAQVARAFSLDMGLPAGWSTMEPSQETEIQFQAVSDMLDSHDRKNLLELVRMLSKGESSRRVSDEVLGTVQEGYSIFRCTSPDAWDQLPLRKVPEDTAIQSALLTLERCRLNHRKADQELEKLLVLARTGDWLQVIQHGLIAKAGEENPTYYSKQLPSELVVALHVLSDKSLAELLPIYRSQTLATLQVLQTYDQHYRDLLQRQRSMAFADISHALARWINRSLASAPAAEGLAQMEFRMDCGIHHMLLDEFQDTSLEQWEILKPLAQPLGGEPRADRSFFCVGDAKQAIYGWRGGVAEIFESVRETVAGLQDQDLRVSFRSSPPLMQTVNAVFQNLRQHPNFGQCEETAYRWGDHFPEHATAKSSLAGFIRLENGPKIDDDQLSVEEKRQVFLEYSAQQIASLVEQTSAGVGVLLRTNHDVARMISLLRERDVSASQYGGNPLTDSAAVECVLSVVHLMQYPGDQISAFHVFNSPLAEGFPSELVRHPAQLSHWLRQFASRQGLGRLVEWLADLMANRLSWWDQQRLEQLIRMAHDFEAAGGRFAEFERTVEEQRVALPSDSQVKVMTVHGSKGLEFDAVFLPALDAELTRSNQLLVTHRRNPCSPPDGVLRYVNSKMQAFLPERWQQAFHQAKSGSLVEALCLLYVAMTRARRALYMFTHAKGRSARQDFSSLLHSTLAGDSKLLSEANAVLFQTGDPQWFQSQPPIRQLKESRRTSTKIRLATEAASAPPRGLPTAAPSRPDQGVTKVNLPELFTLSSVASTAFGKLIHAFFSRIRWLEEFSLDESALEALAIESLTPDELRHVDIPKAVAYFLTAIQHPDIRKALSKDQYTKSDFDVPISRIHVETERPLHCVINGRMIIGSIDRLVLFFSGDQLVAAEIIDFKTDHPDSDDEGEWLEQRIETHTQQLDTYAVLIARQFSLAQNRITKRLLMLSLGRDIPISSGRTRPRQPTARPKSAGRPKTK